MYDCLFMNGNELLKKLKKLSRLKKVRLELIKKHGKGSHSTLYFGNDKTTIKDLKKKLVHRHFLILGQIKPNLHVLQYVIRYSILIFSFDDALGAGLLKSMLTDLNLAQKDIE